MLPGDGVLTWTDDLDWTVVMIDTEEGVIVSVQSLGQRRTWGRGTGRTEISGNI